MVSVQPYGIKVDRGYGMDAGPVFEAVVLQPGEVRDLGESQTRKPVHVIGK